MKNIKELISSDDLEKALIFFQKDIIDVKMKLFDLDKLEEYEKKIMALQGRLSTSHKEYIHGLMIREVYSAERLKISNALLNLLSDYEGYKIIYIDDTVSYSIEDDDLLLLLRDIRTLRDIKSLNIYRDNLNNILSEHLSEIVIKDAMLTKLHEWKAKEASEFDVEYLERLIKEEIEKRLADSKVKQKIEAIIPKWIDDSQKDIENKLQHIYNRYGYKQKDFNLHPDQTIADFSDKIKITNINDTLKHIDMSDMYGKTAIGMIVVAALLSFLSFGLGIFALIISRFLNLPLSQYFMEKKKEKAYNKLLIEFKDMTKLKQDLKNSFKSNKDFNSFIDNIFNEWFLKMLDVQIINIEKKLQNKR